jgi:cell division protein FtsB
MASNRNRLVLRLAGTALAAASVVFAIEGGEFGTIDLIHQRRAKNQLLRSIDSTKRVVDSLRVYQKAVASDPATQERLAREVFGMVRGDKEILYRFIDSVPPPPRR